MEILFHNSLAQVKQKKSTATAKLHRPLDEPQKAAPAVCWFAIHSLYGATGSTVWETRPEGQQQVTPTAQ